MKLLKSVIIFSFSFISHNLYATTWHVPDSIATIQAGIDSASVGDTVLVSPGIYYEVINNNGKQIVIGSLYLTTGDSSYIDSTIIDGNNSTRPVTILGSVDSTMIFTGFTVQNGSSGGIGCGRGASPIISHNIVRNNHSSASAGIACSGAGIPLIRYNKIVENSNSSSVGYSGGGIACYLSGSPIIHKNIIKDYSAYNGGGIYCANNSNPEIRYNLICDNQSANTGGGIYSTNSQPLIENNTLYGNYALLWGSAMYEEILNLASPLDPDNTISDIGAFYYHQSSTGTIIPGGNVSGTWTAAGSPYLIQGNITVPVDSTLNIEPGVEVTFQSNYTFLVNGYLEAIGTEADSIQIDGLLSLEFLNAPDSSHLAYCIVTGSTTWFGGIHCYSSNPVITHSRISGFDNVISSGGGINLSLSNPEISYCDITGNTAFNHGGGIYCSDSDPVISHCNISGNSASTSGGQGGGISVRDGSIITVSNCTINDNFAEDGGGLYFYGGIGTISDCIISGDSSIARGGGIYIQSPSGDFTFTNTTISHCYAGEEGGAAIFIHTVGALTMERCIIDDNFTYSYFGGAMYVDGCDSLIMDHCDVLNNYSKLSGSGVHLFGNTNFILTNSIFKGQEAYDIVFHNPALASVSYCNFDNQHNAPFANPPTGSGTLSQTNVNGDSCDAFYNIYMDPLFVDFGGGDYHLTENSPCIDAGDPASPLDPDSTVTDMGVYYFNQLFPIISVFQDSLEFGNVEIGTQKDTTLTIYNQGTDTLFINQINLNNSYFTTSFDSVNNFVLPNDSMLMIVTFTPTNSGFFDDTLAIDNNDHLVEIYLSGTGVIAPFPAITVSDSSLNFGTVLVGHQADSSFTIFNVGTDTLTIISLTNNQNVFSNNFSAVDSLIPPGDSLEIIVSFTPANNSTVIDTLSITNNDHLVEICLSGTGVIAPFPAITVSDSSLNFGTVLVGHQADSSFTIFNVGTDTLTIISLTNNQNVFSNNFSAVDSLIPPGDSLEIIVSFTPADTSTVLDTLSITNNDHFLEIYLNGTGDIIDGINNELIIPKVYVLYPAYPNPFNPTTTIKFDLLKYSFVDLKVYNIMGEEVSTLISKEMKAGRYEYIWNANNLASGVYFYRLNAGKYSTIMKIILVK